MPKVLSTSNGIPLSWATCHAKSSLYAEMKWEEYITNQSPTLASSGRGATVFFGLPMLST